MPDATLVSLQIFSYVVAGTMGFILGRLTGRTAGFEQPEFRIISKENASKPEVKQRKEITLDERKFVTTIPLDSLTDKNGELGTSTIVDDNVSTSVSRLARLKKNKQ
jgi:hypothetical protein